MRKFIFDGCTPRSSPHRPWCRGVSLLSQFPPLPGGCEAPIVPNTHHVTRESSVSGSLAETDDIEPHLAMTHRLSSCKLCSVCSSLFSQLPETLCPTRLLSITADLLSQEKMIATNLIIKQKNHSYENKVRQLQR